MKTNLLDAVQDYEHSRERLKEQVMEQLVWHNCAGECKCEFCTMGKRWLQISNLNTGRTIQ